MNASMRYATAIFEIGIEEHLNLLEDMQEMARTLENQELNSFFSSVMFNFDEKNEVAKKIFTKNDMLKNTFLLLIEKNRTNLFGEIFIHFKKLQYERDGILEINITSAMPINDDILSKIKEKLSEKMGKRIIANVIIDASLLGGISIDLGNGTLDSTIKEKLRQIHQILV